MKAKLKVRGKLLCADCGSDTYLFEVNVFSYDIKMILCGSCIDKREEENETEEE